jgi:hypothetical protein
MSKKNTWVIIYNLLMGVFAVILLCLPWFIMGYVKYNTLLTVGNCVAGEAVAHHRGATYYNFEIDGKTYKENAGGGAPSCIGKKFIVIFDPNNPNNSQMLFKRIVDSVPDCSAIEELRHEVSFFNMHM